MQALQMVSALPMPQSEVLHAVACDIGETAAKRVIELAKNYHIVAYREGYGLPEPVLFSERVWTKFNGSGADRIVGAIRPGVRPGDAAYAAMT